MEVSGYEAIKKLKEYKRVRELYKQGWATRDIAKIVGKSYQWVWIVVRGKGIKEIEKLKLTDLTLKGKV